MSEDSVKQINAELAREIARQGELRLAALLSLGTAADQRATALCGIFGASGIAIAAAVLANLASGRPVLSLIIAGTVVASGLLGAAALAGHTGMPRLYYISGGSPDNLRNWAWDGFDWRSETEMLEASAMRYAASIRENQQILEMGSRRISAAFAVAASSPIVGIAAFVGSYFVTPPF